MEIQIHFHLLQLPPGGSGLWWAICQFDPEGADKSTVFPSSPLTFDILVSEPPRDLCCLWWTIIIRICSVLFSEDSLVPIGWSTRDDEVTTEAEERRRKKPKVSKFANLKSSEHSVHFNYFRFLSKDTSSGSESMNHLIMAEARVPIPTNSFTPSIRKKKRRLSVTFQHSLCLSSESEEHWQVQGIPSGATTHHPLSTRRLRWGSLSVADNWMQQQQ